MKLEINTETVLDVNYAKPFALGIILKLLIRKRLRLMMGIALTVGIAFQFVQQAAFH